MSAGLYHDELADLVDLKGHVEVDGGRPHQIQVVVVVPCAHAVRNGREGKVVGQGTEESVQDDAHLLRDRDHDAHIQKGQLLVQKNLVELPAHGLGHLLDVRVLAHVDRLDGRQDE